MGDIRDVHGIGPKRANDLKRYYNIRTISTLRKFVKKVPNIISPAQKLGLRYHDKISKRIPYGEAKKHVKFIKKKVPSVTIAGSYRRGLKKIGDIDMITTGSLKRVVRILYEEKYIIASLTDGKSMFSGVAKLPGTSNYRKIDIISTTRESKPFSLLYFTGDFVQNINMRQKAKSMGYMLSQHGLRNISTGKNVKKINSEKDIFKFLKMEYKPPEKRSHALKKKP